jgi:hypothetical protein
MVDTNRRPKLPRQNDLICAGTLSAHGAAIAEQNGGSVRGTVVITGHAA